MKKLLLLFGLTAILLSCSSKDHNNPIGDDDPPSAWGIQLPSKISLDNGVKYDFIYTEYGEIDEIIKNKPLSSKDNFKGIRIYWDEYGNVVGADVNYFDGGVKTIDFGYEGRRIQARINGNQYEENLYLNSDDFTKAVLDKLVDSEGNNHYYNWSNETDLLGFDLNKYSYITDPDVLCFMFDVVGPRWLLAAYADDEIIRSSLGLGLATSFEIDGKRAEVNWDNYLYLEDTGFYVPKEMYLSGSYTDARKGTIKYGTFKTKKIRAQGTKVRVTPINKY